ncbi:hypothetical protein BGW38_001610 [Lunasporangiospora selenospora]|uniref:NAD(P)-dependent dehydrogenase, short-chain alcohol dehydrogenase family n=1 Tax=Lunasporangiospora selenospora TaxID=979761 RepID=A0A9P6KE07_9FUNG|nr:hypothetical protein BGW38_001610 [Lunasporangiospora selenospora]
MRVEKASHTEIAGWLNRIEAATGRLERASKTPLGQLERFHGFPRHSTPPTFWKTYVSGPKYSYDQMPDLTGKVAIVTGANIGLGYATMVALAGHGAHVFAACRSKQRATEAIERALVEVKERFPNTAPQDPQIEFLELDLNDLHKVRRAAKEFLDRGLPLHILVNNSGIMGVPYQLSADGIESQFAVNHMGHFVFTMDLLDRIKTSQPSRIVVLSSLGHETTVKGGIDFETLNDETKSSAMTRYGRSKLANILFGKALARRLKDERVYVNIAHPGFVATALSRSANETYGASAEKVFDFMKSWMAMTPETGALTQLYLATTAYARDEELQEKLWEFSEELVREKLGKKKPAAAAAAAATSSSAGPKN